MVVEEVVVEVVVEVEGLMVVAWKIEAQADVEGRMAEEYYC